MCRAVFTFRADKLVVRKSHRGLQQRRVDVAAPSRSLAPKERGADPESERHGAHVVRAYRVSGGRSSVDDASVGRHQPASCLHDDVHSSAVCFRALPAERRHGTDDETGESSA